MGPQDFAVRLSPVHAREGGIFGYLRAVNLESLAPTPAVSHTLEAPQAARLFISISVQ